MQDEVRCDVPGNKITYQRMHLQYVFNKEIEMVEFFEKLLLAAKK